MSDNHVHYTKTTKSVIGDVFSIIKTGSSKKVKDLNYNPTKLNIKCNGKTKKIIRNNGNIKTINMIHQTTPASQLHSKLGYLYKTSTNLSKGTDPDSLTDFKDGKTVQSDECQHDSFQNMYINNKC